MVFLILAFRLADLSKRISKNEKLAMTSQFDLIRFYDVIIRNSNFKLGFLNREYQIPIKFSH